MSKGFTLIELLAVISIMVLLTSITLPNYKSGDQNLSLERAAHKLSQDLRRAQGMAVSVSRFSEEDPMGYGVYFNLNQLESYVIFADLNGDKLYSGPQEKAEEIEIEGKVEIISLSPISGTSLTICFVPPVPGVFFNDFNEDSLASIEISVGELNKEVFINKIGLIYIGDE
jgi:prepilin-type N-terminal cleavage/methylation domain-containing protein